MKLIKKTLPLATILLFINACSTHINIGDIPEIENKNQITFTSSILDKNVNENIVDKMEYNIVNVLSKENFTKLFKNTKEKEVVMNTTRNFESNIENEIIINTNKDYIKSINISEREGEKTLKKEYDVVKTGYIISYKVKEENNNKQINLNINLSRENKINKIEIDEANFIETPDIDYKSYSLNAKYKDEIYIVIKRKQKDNNKDELIVIYIK